MFFQLFSFFLSPVLAIKSWRVVIGAEAEPVEESSRHDILQCGMKLLNKYKTKPGVYNALNGKSQAITLTSFKNVAGNEPVSCKNPKNLFNFLDTDQTEELDFEEFGRLFVSDEEEDIIGYAILKAFNDAERTETIFRLLDVNTNSRYVKPSGNLKFIDTDNERISFEEIKQVLPDGTVEKDLNVDEILAQVNKTHGVSGDGLGSFTDMDIQKFYLGNLLLKNFASLKQAYLALDLDMDGIEAEELINNPITKELLQEGRERMNYVALVGHLDVDGSGGIDMEELVEAFFAHQFDDLVSDAIVMKSEGDPDNYEANVGEKKGLEAFLQSVGLTHSWSVNWALRERARRNGRKLGLEMQLLRPNIHYDEMVFVIDWDGDGIFDEEEYDDVVFSPASRKDLLEALVFLFEDGNDVSNDEALKGKLQKVFKEHLDEDKSGEVDSQELLEAVREEFEDLFDYLDDDQSNYLTITELAKLEGNGVTNKEVGSISV